MSASSWAVVGGADSALILAADEYRDEMLIQLQSMAADGADPVFLGFGEDAVSESGLFLGSIGHTVRVLGAKARLAVYALSAANASGGIETHTSIEYRHTLNYPIWQKLPEQGHGPELIHASPLDDYDAVVTTWDPFLLIFDMNVVAGAGSFTLHLASDDSVVETVDIGDATVDGGTCEFSLLAPLTPATEYYIKATPGILTNEDSTPWAGITDETTWNFTTGML